MAREAGALGFGMRVRSVTTLRSLVASRIVTERLLASVGAACALMGLVLAVVGLFGLLNYAVAERTAEFGIRRALGASRRGIHGLVFNEAVGPVVLGLSAGLIASLLVIHAMRAVLFDVGTVGSAGGGRGPRRVSRRGGGGRRDSRAPGGQGQSGDRAPAELMGLMQTA